jgi:hypothetical protein
MSHDFSAAVRDSNWSLALSVLGAEEKPRSLRCPSSSPPAWFVEVNAPPQAVVECAKLCLSPAEFRADSFGLLELCIPLAQTSSNAFETFAALLAEGVSPNRIVSGGDTLLQYLIRLNRVREIEELLLYGVDPHHMNVFGRESTSNLEGAQRSGNDAGRVALARFTN